MLCDDVFVLWCFFLSPPPSTGFYILLYDSFWIQTSSHWLTCGFPSTNDSCMYLLLCHNMKHFQNSGIFISRLSCSMSFVFLSHTLQHILVCSLHWLSSDSLGGHRSQSSSVHTAIRSCFPVSSHSYVHVLSIFCVYLGSVFKIYWMSSYSPNTTPGLLSWLDGVLDICCVPSLKLPAGGEYRNINHLFSAREAFVWVEIASLGE